MTTTTNQPKGTFSVIVVLIIMLSAGLVRAQSSYIEDFSDNQYENTGASDVDWNTDDGELKLFPYVPELVGSAGSFNDPTQVVVAGDYAYVTDGTSGVQIVDISDRTNPQLVRLVDTPGIAAEVQVVGNLAYVGDSTAGLTIIDISDPLTATVLRTYSTPDRARGLHVVGDIIYVADGSSLLTADVSDPMSVTPLGLLPISGTVRDVRVSGNIALIAADSGGVVVVDVTDPANPIQLTVIPLNYAYGVDIAGDYGYVSNLHDGIAVIDFSDPNTAFAAGQVNTPGTAIRLMVSGSRAYLADAFFGLRVIDITDPTNPVLDDMFRTVGNDAAGVFIDGQYAYVMDRASGMEIVRIADRVAPTGVGGAFPGASILGLSVSGDWAFFRSSSSEFTAVNISDPTAPAETGVLPIPFIWSTCIDGNYAYVGTADGDLNVVDVTDKTDMAIVGSLFLGSMLEEVVVRDNFAFVAGNTSGVYVVDISNPALPEQVGSVPTTGSAAGLCVSGNVAYVAVLSGSLALFDISDPANINLIDSFATGGQPNDVIVSGDRAFVSAGSAGLIVVDVSDPAAMNLAGSTLTTGWVAHTQLAGDLAYISDWDGGLKVYNISNPANISYVDAYQDVTNIREFALDGAYGFAATEGYGLQAVQVLQHDWDMSRRWGVSLTFQSLPKPPVRGRIIPTQVGDVEWEIATSAGAYIEAPVDGSWVDFGFPGTNMWWLSNHNWAPGTNSAVSQIEFQWLYSDGSIAAVTDIADDQGGWLQLDVTRSGHDFDTEYLTLVTGYQVYRRVDDPVFAAQVEHDGQPLAGMKINNGVLAAHGDEALRTLDGRQFLLSSAKAGGTYPAGTWELLGFHAATQQPTYSIAVPTRADSTASGPGWTSFFVTTHTTDPQEWFASEPDSGYSVDNIAPGVPSGITAAYQPNAVDLDWDDAPESDFQFYRVYRGSSEAFIPGPSNLIRETASSQWSDPTANPWSFHYKITTLDHAGNESDVGSVGTVSDVPGSGDGIRFGLQNAVPNPFNPATMIHYSIAKPGMVELVVYDLSGRAVRTLISQSQASGTHQVQWNGQNDAGQAVASGVYLYQLRSGRQIERKRMVLLK